MFQSVWVYDEFEMGITGVTEWDLVCDRQWMVGMASSFYMLGLLLGSFVVGFSSDRYQRPIHKSCKYMNNLDMEENQFCCAC